MWRQRRGVPRARAIARRAVGAAGDAGRIGRGAAGQAGGAVAGGVVVAVAAPKGSGRCTWSSAVNWR